MDPFDSPLGGFLDNEMANRLFEARTIVINEEVSADLAARLTEQLATMGAVSEEPVRVLVTRLVGDDLDAGLSLYDLLRSAAAPVDVLVTGQIGGAGLLTYLAVSAEHRYSLPNARFVLQKGTSSSPTSNASDAAEQTRELRRRMADIVAEATGRDAEGVQSDLEKPTWLSAKEAKEYGLVGRVIRNAKEME